MNKIVKQSGCFAKIGDGEFNKKHIGVNLFSLQLAMLKILWEKGTKLVAKPMML